MVALVTLALPAATPAHVKNYPPKAFAQKAADKVPTEKPEPKSTVKKASAVKPAKVATQTEKPAVRSTAPPAPPPAPVTGCGSDPNMAYIYQHESGCNTASINAGSGACGLGQALPCSKLPCTLYDWSCQNNWFVAYATRTYGSTYAAYLFWTAHSWW